VVGSGGNLSARLPGTDECWVTATGTWLDRLHPSSFARVRISDGAAVDSAAPSATSELGLHLAMYRARPDVAAVVHLHPQSVLLLDALDEPVRLITTDHVYYVRRVARTPFAAPGTPAVGELAAAAALDGADCIVLAQHGCSVLADSVELAHKRALYLEEAARLTYAALAVGRADKLRDCPADWASGLGPPGRGAV
jgi:ribulose-5-phosphate 4-epimerase/fuculose-1-phosphate aldolase